MLLLIHLGCVAISYLTIITALVAQHYTRDRNFNWLLQMSRIGLGGLIVSGIGLAVSQRVAIAGVCERGLIVLVSLLLLQLWYQRLEVRSIQSSDI